MRRADLPVANVPDRPIRPVQEGVPQARKQRDAMVSAIRRYVGKVRPVPPLSFEELRLHTDEVIRLTEAREEHRAYVAVLVNNEVWSETLAGVPYNRRLLLLPQCLQHQGECPSEVDEFGLACQQCGRCVIGDLKTEAERLGYVVLVAEGTTIVTSLIQQGKIDAVVGVSCLSVLERVFPHMVAAAVPGIAIPLLQDGCANTSIDLDWVWDALYLTSKDQTRRLDLNSLRGEVQSWFTAESLEAVLGAARSRTEKIGRLWLAKSGKRWRPFLAVCAFQAFQDHPEATLQEELKKIALAVECFHKASLIHDDIEDDDKLRYGQKTVHEEYGLPVALNVGDFLLGEGYRLIGASGASDRQIARMLQVAAEGHRRLSLGQGEELCWRREPRPLSTSQVLEIFWQKTAPAFDVSLRLGAICAGAEEGIWRVLRDYSKYVGIAYQIRDDVRDWRRQGDGDVFRMRPSLVMAMARERATGRDRELLDALWPGTLSRPTAAATIDKLFADLNVEAETLRLMEDYKQEAIRCLNQLDNANLKGLLRRVAGRIFDDFERGRQTRPASLPREGRRATSGDVGAGWCREHKVGNAANRRKGKGTSA